MTNSVWEIILYLNNSRTESEFVFLGKKGVPLPYGHIYCQFAEAQRDAGIKNKIRFHDLRHTFASNYMMSRGNVFDLQKLLGHTKIEMTMVYAHLSPNHLQGSLQFMSNSNDLKIEVDSGSRTDTEPSDFSHSKKLVILDA